jgi:hypothetical protein
MGVCLWRRPHHLAREAPPIGVVKMKSRNQRMAELALNLGLDVAPLTNGSVHHHVQVILSTREQQTHQLSR